MFGWFDKVSQDGNYYIIRDFPRYNFSLALRKHYKTTKLAYLFESVGLTWLNTGSVKVNAFFIPEIVYLLNTLGFPRKLVDAIVDGTWMKRVYETNVPNRVDMSLVHRDMNVELRQHQSDFVAQYDVNRYKYMLNGALLSFDQGLGKTITALALMTALKKKQVIIFAPKNTLETVWSHHIDQFYKEKKKISLSIEKNIDPTADFIITTYPAMSDVSEITHRLTSVPEELGIIVDESHNFLRLSSDRTQDLISLRQKLRCNDTLLMSGTPVKALGVELMPMLMVLDNFFDLDAMDKFKKALGLNTTIATDVLRARLQVMMHRKLKSEVEQLPPKTEETLQVKIPGGERYTLDSVKKAMVVFSEERLKYHKDHMAEYVNTYYRIIKEVKEQKTLKDLKGLEEYLQMVDHFRKHPVSAMNKDDMEAVKLANDFEKHTLMPAMSQTQKKEFEKVKSAVKYVHLKVKGEVIGQLLTKLRMQMSSEIVRHSDLLRIVSEAEKKTVIFTSYLEAVEAASTWATENKLEPLTVTGENVSDVKDLVKRFTTDPKLNPLIATTQTMSTGVTLTVANTVVFLNKPWRHTEYAQASDRVHRIGQDTACFIYTLLLDTGEQPNLSTRMEDIMQWSADLFSRIVGDN